VSMLDRSYELAIYTVGFLYLAIYISSIVDVFLDSSRYENGKLPFIIGAMPLMAITFKMLVNQGLCAYNSIKLFIGKKSCFDKGNVKIAVVYKNSFTNRVKINITIDSAVNMKDRKFVIRTSLDNLQPFIELYGK
jgi:hypothetical protein